MSYLDNKLDGKEGVPAPQPPAVKVTIRLRSHGTGWAWGALKFHGLERAPVPPNPWVWGTSSILNQLYKWLAPQSRVPSHLGIPI